MAFVFACGDDDDDTPAPDATSPVDATAPIDAAASPIDAGAADGSNIDAMCPGALEVCDGLDNDCNGLVDDGTQWANLGDTCSVGVGACLRVGVFVCDGADPSGPSVCSVSAGSPSSEVCDYLDNDCNDAVDETFTSLGDDCSVGVGACETFGVEICRADGTGTECSVSAGAPETETCNGLDDDCNGAIDESFTGLGTLCSVGTGLCEAFGVEICRSDGTGTECSVSPGVGSTEICNGADDDCDGLVDDGFRNPATGEYDLDTACGSCFVDCTEIFDKPNAFGTCDASSTPTCVMNCDAGSFDLNGSVSDGCEFTIDAGAVYVNESIGSDAAGCGSPFSPCATIAAGTAEAVSLGRGTIRVANGFYEETVTVTDGIDLVGGHDEVTWELDVASTATFVLGSPPATFAATGITSPTVVRGFTILGPINTLPSGNSYAVYVSASSANLSILDNKIFAGVGGPGTPGSAGSAGASGEDGEGRASSPPAYDAFVTTGSPCDSSNNRQHDNGGANNCGSLDVSGGSGGGNQCPPAFDTETSAIDGLSGSGGGGAGGDAAEDGLLDGSGTCFVPSTSTPFEPPMSGKAGSDGEDGSNGPGGSGCTSAVGSVIGGHWRSGSGFGGGNGTAGTGGGGGGAGGGGQCSGCADGKDILGGHGGGGAAAGCGGAGGNGGTGGGGSFGIFITGGSAPTISGNSMQLGTGGAGAAGGPGGRGGFGGDGGLGGTCSDPSCFCSGDGGNGGNGGDGGQGGGGGGGCGGSAFGIYSSGIGTPSYCDAGSGNTFVGGTGGPGGSGGPSLGGDGISGSAGAVASCSFN